MRANPSNPESSFWFPPILFPPFAKKREGWGTRTVLNPGAFHRVFYRVARVDLSAQHYGVNCLDSAGTKAEPQRGRHKLPNLISSQEVQVSGLPWAFSDCHASPSH